MKKNKMKENKMKENKMKEIIIGKNVIVRTKLAGVHFGTVENVDFSTNTIALKNSRRLWRVFTRDKSGSISDVAANGLKLGENHSIGALLELVIMSEPSGLEIDKCTDVASQSILSWETV